MLLPMIGIVTYRLGDDRSRAALIFVDTHIEPLHQTMRRKPAA